MEVLPAPTAPHAPPNGLLEALVPRGKSLRDSAWAVHEWVRAALVLARRLTRERGGPPPARCLPPTSAPIPSINGVDRPSKATADALSPMKRLLPSLLAIAAVVPAVVAATVPTATQSAVDVGDEVAYTFRAAPVNAMGITGLDELRGKPVLVEFWGTR